MRWKTLPNAPNNHPYRQRLEMILMTPEEGEQMERLCKQINNEKDHDRFMQLVTELNDLLESKAKRLESHPKKPKSN
jgi:hypothetical protein